MAAETRDGRAGSGRRDGATDGRADGREGANTASVDRSSGSGSVTGPGSASGAVTGEGTGTASARERLAERQAGLLAALVAGAPAPEGFDVERLAVQSRALVGKRTGVVAKVAPELPEILGESAFRARFHEYARSTPMTGGYRRDALDFAAHVLDEDSAGSPRARRALRAWWLERSGPEPLPDGRLRRALRLALGR